MKKYELGLAKGYVSSWSIQDALREFTQNGIDQEVSLPGNTFTAEYDPKTETLRFCNKKSVLQKSTLLLGHSSKQGDDKTIGQFGEGYKLAVLVLLRDGCDVSIENYGARELWRFRFSKMRKYDNVESLIVEIETAHIWKKVPNNDLTIVVKGITEEDMEKYNGRILGELPDDEVIDTSYGQALLAGEYRGKIFVNGLFVADKPDFIYGYNIKPAYLSIGRDRDLVDSFDIASITRHLWLESERKDLILEMVRNGVADIGHITYSWNTMRTSPSGYSIPQREKTYSKEVADASWKGVCDEYGEEVLVVADTSDKIMAEKKYHNKKKVVVVPHTIASLIGQYSEEYERFLEEVEKAAEEAEKTLSDEIYLWADDIGIGPSEIDNLTDILERYKVNLDAVA